MTLADIAERVETEEEITASKISYRLNALYKTDGSGVEKGEVVVKNEDNKTRKLVGYRKVN